LKLDGAKVRRTRERRGLSLAALAKEAGLAKGTALRADHGEDVQLVTARKLARALGVEVADLMREEPEGEEADRAA
jgi:transcriptional regulator with XRE-family HTH domain